MSAARRERMRRRRNERRERVSRRRSERRGAKSGGGAPHEPYQEFGRGAEDNAEMQRLLEGGDQYGGDYRGALGQQQALYDQYGDIASGEAGPSLGEQALDAGMDEAAATAAAQANSARGGNISGAQAASAQAAGQMGAQASQQGALLRAQEQQQALAAQAGLAGDMAAQGFEGQMGFESMRQGALGSQLEGDVGYRLGSRELRAQERQAKSDRARANVKTVADPGGVLNSDERVKQNIRPGNMQASQAVGELDPYAFEYEAGYGPAGVEHIGIMAQDLEKVAPQAVLDTPKGKMIHAGQAAGLGLAAAADQEQRIRALEGGGPAAGADEETAYALSDARRKRNIRSAGGAAPRSDGWQNEDDEDSTNYVLSDKDAKMNIKKVGSFGGDEEEEEGGGGGLGKVAGILGLLSDERVKQNVRSARKGPGGGDVSDIMGEMTAYGRGYDSALADATGGGGSGRPEDRRFEQRQASGMSSGGAAAQKRDIESELFAPTHSDPAYEYNMALMDAEQGARARIADYDKQLQAKGANQPSPESQQMSYELGMESPYAIDPSKAATPAMMSEPPREEKKKKLSGFPMSGLINMFSGGGR